MRGRAPAKLAPTAPTAPPVAVAPSASLATQRLRALASTPPGCGERRIQPGPAVAPTASNAYASGSGSPRIDARPGSREARACRPDRSAGGGRTVGFPGTSGSDARPRTPGSSERRIQPESSESAGASRDDHRAAASPGRASAKLAPAGPTTPASPAPAGPTRSLALPADASAASSQSPGNPPALLGTTTGRPRPVVKAKSHVKQNKATGDLF